MLRLDKALRLTLEDRICNVGVRGFGMNLVRNAAGKLAPAAPAHPKRGRSVYWNSETLASRGEWCETLHKYRLTVSEVVSPKPSEPALNPKTHRPLILHTHGQEGKAPQAGLGGLPFLLRAFLAV